MFRFLSPRTLAGALVIALSIAAAPAARADAEQDRLKELERRLEVLAQEVERLRMGETKVQPSAGAYGLGPAASRIYRSPQGVSIGGYGEALYSNPMEELDDGDPSGRISQWDHLRQVVYLGYKFSDWALLNSEIEFEHASTGKGGEVSVEFGYLDFLIRPEFNVRAGMVLVPSGLINELHEPTVFLGARRPQVETTIIPTTWRENGVGVFGELGPIAYRTYLMAGLDASRFTASGIRDGRQSGARSKAEDLAWAGRADFVAMPGALFGGSVYYGQSGQGMVDAEGTTLQVPVFLAEAHAEWRQAGLDLRVLAVTGKIDEADELNEARGLVGRAGVGRQQFGAYAQAGYDLLSHRGGNWAVIPFVRYEVLDTQSKAAAGAERDPAQDQDLLTIGLSVRPLDQVVFKADYQDAGNEAERGSDQVNVSLGFIF